MKKKFLLFINIISSVMLFATAPTTIAVPSTGGGLSTAITSAGGDLNTVTNLAVTGVLDARDFVTMRDKMPLLAVIDLSGTTIAAYSGAGGTDTYAWYGTIYTANTMPR